MYGLFVRQIRQLTGVFIWTGWLLQRRYKKGFLSFVSFTKWEQNLPLCVVCFLTKEKTVLDFGILLYEGFFSTRAKLHAKVRHRKNLSREDFLHYNKYLYVCQSMLQWSLSISLTMYKCHISRSYMILQSNCESQETTKSMYCSYEFILLYYGKWRRENWLAMQRIRYVNLCYIGVMYRFVVYSSKRVVI